MENPDYPAKGMARQAPKHQATLGIDLQKAPGIHAAGCSDDHPDRNGMPDCLDLIARSALFLPFPGIGPPLPKSAFTTSLRPVSGLIADPPARE
jgi:hypothetical protein